MCRRRAFVDRGGTYYTCKENGGLSRMVPMPNIDRIGTLETEVMAGFFGVCFGYSGALGFPRFHTGKHLCYFSQKYRSLYVYVLKNKNKGLTLDMTEAKGVHFFASRKYKKKGKNMIGKTTNRVQIVFDFGTVMLDFLNHVTAYRWMLALTAVHGGFSILDAPDPSIWHDGVKYYNSQLSRESGAETGIGTRVTPGEVAEIEIDGEDGLDLVDGDRFMKDLAEGKYTLLKKSASSDVVEQDEADTEASEDVSVLALTPPILTDSSASNRSRTEDPTFTNKTYNTWSDSVFIYKVGKPNEVGSNASCPPTEKDQEGSQFCTDRDEEGGATRSAASIDVSDKVPSNPFTSEVDCTLSDFTAVETGISDITCNTAVYGKWRNAKTVCFPRRTVPPNPFRKQFLGSEKSLAESDEVKYVDDYERKPVSQLKELLGTTSFRPSPYKSAVPTPIAGKKTAAELGRITESFDSAAHVEDDIYVSYADIVKDDENEGEEVEEDKLEGNHVGIAILKAANEPIHTPETHPTYAEVVKSSASNESLVEKGIREVKPVADAELTRNKRVSLKPFFVAKSEPAPPRIMTKNESKKEAFVLGNAMLKAADSFSSRMPTKTDSEVTHGTFALSGSCNSLNGASVGIDKIKTKAPSNATSVRSLHKENKISGLMNYWAQVESGKAKNGNADFYPDTQA